MLVIWEIPLGVVIEEEDGYIHSTTPVDGIAASSRGSKG
jgi:hypothetical protein